MKNGILLFFASFLILLIRCEQLTETDYNIFNVISQSHSLFGKLTFYEILSLPNQGATFQQIQKSFKKLSLIHHPDKKQEKQQNDDKFNCLSEIYKILKEEKAREKYDFWLENGIPYFYNPYTRRYFKSENLSIFGSFFVVLGFIVFVDYFLMLLKYFRLRHGLGLVEKYLLMSLKQQKQSKTGKSGGSRRGSAAPVSDDKNVGLFDDLNVKYSIDYLVRQCNVPVETVFYKWEELKGKLDEFNRFPSIFDGILFRLVFGLFYGKKKVKGEDKETDEDEHVLVDAKSNKDK